MDILSKLFGSAAYVKIMRLFLCNPETPFEAQDIKARAKVSNNLCRRELARLVSLGMVRRRDFIKKIEKRTKKSSKVLRKRVHGFVLDKDFPYTEPLRAVLFQNESFQKDGIARRLKGAGAIKMLVLSGVFSGRDNPETLDIMIVGDRLKKRAIDTAIKAVESEMGRELKYAVLKTPDFLYRLEMCDKFVRDVLDYPHEKLINRMGNKAF